MGTAFQRYGNVSIESPVCDVIVVKSFTVKNKHKRPGLAHIFKKAEPSTICSELGKCADPLTIHYGPQELLSKGFLSLTRGPDTHRLGQFELSQLTLSRILLLTMGRTPLEAMHRKGPMSFRRTL